jgi:hypothetical protein
MLRFYPIVCEGLEILYVIFIGFIGLCKHAIFREAYIKEYRRRTRGQNQGVVRCPCQSPNGLLGPGYHLYADYCVPNSGRRYKNIDPTFKRR